jgi:hypothetical protein
MNLVRNGFFAENEDWHSPKIPSGSTTTVDPRNNNGRNLPHGKVANLHIPDSDIGSLRGFGGLDGFLHYFPLLIGYAGLSHDPHKKKYRQGRLYPRGKLRNKIIDYLLSGLAVIVGFPGLISFAWGMVYLQNGISGAGLRILSGIALLLVSGILSWLSGGVAVREMERERKESRND